jgi:hypothetical protein
LLTAATVLNSVAHRYRQSLIGLTPLKSIPQNDLSFWLKNEVYEMLMELSKNEIQTETLIQNNFLWKPTPLGVLDEICRTLLSKGTSAIESYWETLS